MSFICSEEQARSFLFESAGLSKTNGTKRLNPCDRKITTLKTTFDCSQQVVTQVLESPIFDILLLCLRAHIVLVSSKCAGVGGGDSIVKL